MTAKPEARVCKKLETSGFFAFQKKGKVGLFMKKDKFWQTIANAQKNNASGESLEKPLTAELQMLTPSEIVAFHNIYRLYMDAANKPLVKAAAEQRDGYMSADGWDYFRSGLVAAGRTAYFAALLDPDSIATLGRGQQYFGDELAMYASNQAYAALEYGDVYADAEARRLSGSEVERYARKSHTTRKSMKCRSV
jgi:hypothetical protein